ncbi:MAG: hypothetical protein LAP39_17035 [Acidobacteriia bacterium]|nr:hypothetical protein [Terriglobia bacterium]
MARESEEQKGGLVGEIADNLGTLFRHLLPGALIIGFAAVTHPLWFAGLGLKPEWPHLAITGVIAVAVGNACYAVNRYGVYQVVDYFCWRAGSEGPAKRGKAVYLDDLTDYVQEALVAKDVPSRARQHVAFRASAVLLIYTMSELSLLAAFWREPTATISAYAPQFVIGSVLLGLIGVWQNVITRRIDAAALHRRSPRPSERDPLSEKGAGASA